MASELAKRFTWESVGSILYMDVTTRYNALKTSWLKGDVSDIDAELKKLQTTINEESKQAEDLIKKYRSELDQDSGYRWSNYAGTREFSNTAFIVARIHLTSELNQAVNEALTKSSHNRSRH